MKQDDFEAVKWFQRAADEGYDEAQFYLGVAYEVWSVYALALLFTTVPQEWMGNPTGP